MSKYSVEIRKDKLKYLIYMKIFNFHRFDHSIKINKPVESQIFSYKYKYNDPWKEVAIHRRRECIFFPYTRLRINNRTWKIFAISEKFSKSNWFIISRFVVYIGRAYTIRLGDTAVPFSSRLLFSIRFNLVNPRPCWSGVERALRRASIRDVASPASLFGSSACVSLRTYRPTPSPPRSFANLCWKKLPMHRQNSYI